MHTHAPQDVIHNMLCLHEFRNQAMQNSRITSPTQPQPNNPQIVPTRCRTPDKLLEAACKEWGKVGEGSAPEGYGPLCAPSCLSGWGSLNGQVRVLRAELCCTSHNLSHLAGPYCSALKSCYTLQCVHRCNPDWLCSLFY